MTLAPKRRHTEPSSRPITPPPMTTRWLGTSSRSSAPVLSTMRLPALSTVTPGRGVTEEPVAMTMSLAVTFSPPTLTVCASSNAAWPLSQVTLFFLNRNSIPPVSSPTALVFSAIIRPRSSVGVAVMPQVAKWPFDASSNSSEPCSSALDGMHPTLRHVPPSVARLSTQAVFSPSCAVRIAAT